MRDDDWGPMGPGRGWDGPDGWGMHDGWGVGGWIMMALLALLLLGLLAALVLLVVRAAGRRPEDSAHAGSVTRTTAEQVLDERFARGEIDEEEYLRRRSVLRGQSAPGG